MGLSTVAGSAVKNKGCGQEQVESGKIGRQESVAGEKGWWLVSAGNFSKQNTLLIEGQILFDFAGRIDYGRDAGVRAANDRTVIL